jgi:hypothetical protein
MVSGNKSIPQKKQNSQAKPVQKKEQGKPGKTKEQMKDKSSYVDRIDQWLEPHLNLVFYFSLFLTLLVGFFLFDVKISTGGDDSHYIEMANDFLKGRSFPSWHGPLYPIFLSIPMSLFGVKVMLLKMFSLAFVVAHLVLFYLTFKKLVSPTLFALVLLIVSVSSSILYFASQTYTEAMYMFLQSLSVFLFIRTYLKLQSDPPLSLKKEVSSWLVLAFFVFLSSLTRNIGIVALLVMLIFLAYERKFLSSLMLFLSYLVFFVPFKIYKTLAWGSTTTGSSGQLSEMLLKNPYDKSQGSEDFSGIIVRFFENARLYLSKHFMIGIGLHDPGSTDKSWFVTLFIAAIFLIALFYSFRKKSILLFISLYLGAAITATFISLQQSWDQMRMIVIYIPMLLLLLAWGVQQFSERKGFAFLAFVLPFFLVFVFFKTLGHSVEKMKVNQKVLAKNLSGNLYYGFTPDWQNYLLMSKWVGKNIPDTAVVASRKPSMSFIYSNGRDFYGMYRFPSYEPRELVNGIKSRIGDMLVIPNSDFDKNFPPAVRMSFKQAAVAYVAEGSTLYGLYDLKEPMGSALKKASADFKVSSFTTDSLLNRVKVSTLNCFAVSPDSLVNTLKKNRVSYVIVASLRANPNMNTGNIINNIQRYLYFVEQKYPGILTLVHQIGDNAGEPAWLYKLDYNTYHL